MKNSSEVAFNLQAELKSAQSELAALREELAELSEVNIRLRDSLDRSRKMADSFDLSLRWVRFQVTDPVILKYIDIALKPTESGAI